MAPIALFDDDLDFTGAPTPAAAPAASAPPSSPADTLVVASQLAAQDGSYQALVQDLAGKGAQVEMQMVDRIVEGGAFLSLPLLLRTGHGVRTGARSAITLRGRAKDP